MKKITMCMGVMCLIFYLSCAPEKKSNKETITIGNKKKEKEVVQEKSTSVPIMLDNTGVGPIKTLTFEDKIDKNLATKGEQLFKSKCVACHKASQKFIGPPMAGIYKKRHPAWVMNMIMNPDEMTKKDPVAKALLTAYNNTIMINQNIPEDEARAMVEWFRTLEE